MIYKIKLYRVRYILRLKVSAVMSRESGNPCILVKTMLNMEKIAAQRIVEEIPHLRAEASPGGFKGLVLVYGCRDRDEEIRVIEERIPEADRIIPIMGVARAVPDEIASLAAQLAKDLVSPDECFAVRTVRRGSHNFTSIDVNVVVGSSVKEATGACVNLSEPDKIILVEIIKDKAFISIVPGFFEYKKYPKWKKNIIKLMRKIRVVQMPYLGPLEACRKMGVRVGREVQNFEVKELVIAPAGRVDARQLAEFLAGLFEGIESRYGIQKRSYNNRKPRKVPVYVQDIHQFIREHAGEPIIVLEPEGTPVSTAVDQLKRVFSRGKTVNILAGSREGIPLGIYRFADIILDIAPGITLSTEYAVSSALIAIATALYGDLEEAGDDE